MRGEPYFFKINKYYFLGARTNCGGTVQVWMMKPSYGCEYLSILVLSSKSLRNAWFGKEFLPHLTFYNV